MNSVNPSPYSTFSNIESRMLPGQTPENKEDEIVKLFKQYSIKNDGGLLDAVDLIPLLKELKSMEQSGNFNEKQIKSIVKSAGKILQQSGGQESALEKTQLLKEVNYEALYKLGEMHGVYIAIEDNILTIDVNDEAGDESEFPIEKLAKSYPNINRINLSNWDLSKAPIKLSYFKDLEYIRFNSCRLKLSDFPESLKEISIARCNLDNLSSLPKSLNTLIIGNCKIKTLSDLPENLETLMLYGVQITEDLSALPKNLQMLRIYGCFINNLPDFPESLTQFYSQMGYLGQQARLKLFIFHLNRGLLNKIDEHMGFYKIEDLKEAGNVLCEKLNVDTLVQYLEIIKSYFHKKDLMPVALKIVKERPDQFINILDWIGLEALPAEMIDNFPILQPLRNSIANYKKFKEVLAQEDLVVGPYPAISINELKGLFEKINFLDEDQPGYCDPKYLSDDGTPISVEGVKEGLHKLINLISERRSYVGVPVNAEERIAWYEKIESFIKEIIAHLKPIFDAKAQMDDLELLSASKHVIALATAGRHCGGAWNRAALDINKTLQGTWEANVEQGINAYFTKWLQSYKIGIAEKLTQDFTPQVGAAMQPHIFNYLGKILIAEKGFAFPADTFDLDDSLIPDLDDDAVLEAIEEMLTPQALIAFFKSEIDALLKSEGLAGSDMEDRQAGTMMELMRDSIEPYCKKAIEEARINFDKDANYKSKEAYNVNWQDTKIALLDDYLETQGLAKVDKETYAVSISNLGMFYALKHLEYVT